MMFIIAFLLALQGLVANASIFSNNSIEGTSYVPSFNKVPTEADRHACLDSLTQKVWEERNMSDYFKDMLEFGPFPDVWNRSEKHPINMSPLQVVHSYSRRVEDFKCNPQDLSNAHCSSQNLGTKENCEFAEDDPGHNDPRAIMIKKALANWSNNMVSLGQSIAGMVDGIKLDEKKLINEFRLAYRIDQDGKKPALGNLGIEMGPLILLGGYLGAIPNIGGPLAGIVSIFTALNAPDKTVAWEPVFERHQNLMTMLGELQKRFRELGINIADGQLNGIANKIEAGNITEWAGRKSTLTGFMEDGRFASADAQIANVDAIQRLFHAMTVVSLWALDRIILVRYTQESVSERWWGVMLLEFCNDRDKSYNFWVVSFVRGVQGTDNPVPAGYYYGKCFGARRRDGSIYLLRSWSAKDPRVGGLGVPSIVNQKRLNATFGIMVNAVFDRSIDFHKTWGYVGNMSNPGESRKRMNKMVEMHAARIVQDPRIAFEMPWTIPVCELEGPPLPFGEYFETLWKGDKEVAHHAVISTMQLCGTALNWPYDRPAIDDLFIGPVPEYDVYGLVRGGNRPP